MHIYMMCVRVVLFLRIKITRTWQLLAREEESNCWRAEWHESEQLTELGEEDTWGGRAGGS